MRIDGPQITGSFSIGNSTFPNLSSLATTGSNTFIGNQTFSGSLVPALNNTYDLGDSTHQYRHLYLSSGSLYIDGVKVLGSTSEELRITTDAGQSFKILEAGSDTITLQSNDGNITLATSGGGDVILDPTSGIIALKGTTTIYSGNRVLSSDGNAIQFGNSITMTGSLIVTGYIETQELRTTYISSSILYRSGSTKFGDELTDTHAFTGSLLISGSVSAIGSNLVSGSSQVDAMSTTNIARLATTGSNIFTSNQVVTGSISSTGNFTLSSSSGNLDVGGVATVRGNGSSYATHELTTGASNVALYDQKNASGTSINRINAGGSSYIQGGSLGVGVSSPEDILDVRKNQNATTNFYFRNTDTTNASSRAYLNVIAGNTTMSMLALHGGDTYLAGTLNRNMYFQQNPGGTVNMFISGSGYVGINESSPTKRLTVNFGSSVSDGLLVTGTQRQETRFKSSGEHSNVFIDSGHSNIYLPTLGLQRSSTAYGEIKLQRASNSDALGSFTESEMIVGTTTNTPLSFKINEERIVVINSSAINIKSTILPTADATYNLGSTSYRWNNVYTTDLHLSNEGKQNEVDGTWGDWTLQEGENDIYMLNNRSGEKFKIKLEKI